MSVFRTVIYWLAVVVISVVLVILLILFFESRDQADVGAAAPRAGTPGVSSPDAASSPLRFVARNGRVVGRRGAVLLRGVAGRMRLAGGYLAWPDAGEPRQIVPANRPEVAAWIRRTFEPWAARKLDAATWSVLRSRSLVVGG